MNEKAIKQMSHTLLNVIRVGGTPMTTEIIRNEVLKFQAMYPIEKYPSISWEGIINELESHFTITIGTSETLYNYKTPWVRNYKQDNPRLEDFPFWNNYKRYLEEKQNLPKTVIDEIDKSTDAILDGMTNPKNPGNFEKKGLVIGYVQSGKTGNYVGLINKAIDVGYQFIVVLAGMHNNLRQQTQFRIDQGVNGLQRMNGESVKVGVGTLLNRFNTQTQTLTTADSNGDFNSAAANMNGINFNVETPLIAVIKKNVHPLTNMNKWLENVIGINMESQSNKAVLIIDDEADQASINNNFKIEDLDAPMVDEDGNVDYENKPTAINSGIVNLMNKFSRRCYTGYTATPYANVLIPLDNKHHQSIFPEDFIVRLKQPSNYLGPEKYFDQNLPGIFEIDKKEGFSSQLKAYYKEEIEEFEIPESLKLAAKQFIISGAIRFYRGQKDSHMSMLIHVSHLTMIQNYLGTIFRSYWNEIKHGIEQNTTAIWNELKALFSGEISEGLNAVIDSQEYISEKYASNASFQNNNYALPKNFNDLRDDIRSFIASIEVLVVNGHKDNKGQSLDYHLYPKGRKVIAIGGNTMSRGLTLEGLHTSYFIRHARTFDTLMQMGRWFGYRTNYADLCRIITTREIADDFAEICSADAIMNDNISSMIRSNATPKDFLIKIRQSATSLSVTSKMGVAGEMQVSWSGGEVITNSISRNKDTIIHNHDLIIELLDKLKDKLDSATPSTNSKLLFKDVSIDAELDSFENHYLVENNNGKLDLKKIFEFYRKSGFESVDIVVVGRKSGDQTNYTFLDREIGLARRNSKERLDPNHFKVPNGKLTDSNYLSIFIDAEKLELTTKQKQTPSLICEHLKRPIITFVALDPIFFFGKEKVGEGEIHDGISELIDENTGKYIAIPYGMSIATPSKLPNSSVENKNSVSVLVNQMVYENIL